MNNEWMSEWRDECICDWITDWIIFKMMKEWMNEWFSEWMNERINEWTNKRMPFHPISNKFIIQKVSLVLLFVYPKDLICTAKSLYRNIWNKYSQKRNCAATVLISTFMCLWVIYIFPGSVCLFCCRKICEPILGIYKSLTDTWMWKLGLRPRNSFSGNTSMEFSLQSASCLCHWTCPDTPELSMDSPFL